MSTPYVVHINNELARGAEKKLLELGYIQTDNGKLWYHPDHWRLSQSHNRNKSVFCQYTSYHLTPKTKAAREWLNL